MSLLNSKMRQEWFMSCLKMFSCQHLKIYGSLWKCYRSDSCHICRSDSCHVWNSHVAYEQAINDQINEFLEQDSKAHELVTKNIDDAAYGCSGLYIYNTYIWYDPRTRHQTYWPQHKAHELITKHIDDAATAAAVCIYYTCDMTIYVTWPTNLSSNTSNTLATRPTAAPVYIYIHMHMWRDSFMYMWHLYTFMHIWHIYLSHEFVTKYINDIAYGCSGLYMF